MVRNIRVYAKMYSWENDFFDIKFLQLQTSFSSLILQEKIINDLKPLANMRDGPNLTLAQERLSLEKQSKDQRLEQMCHINPKYVLRNHLAQNAIELAQKKDFSEVTRLLKILENPYESQAVPEDYAMGPPPELAHMAISCSS